MEQCYDCGDVCVRAEMAECDLCRKNVCDRCSMAHFRVHFLDGELDDGRGEAFYHEEDLDELEVPDEDEFYGDW